VWPKRCGASCVAKRAFDLIGAALALVLLAPLLLLLALWVRLDSPGPVLYRQERVGRFGVPFHIHKFRTMKAAGGGLPLTVGEDPRITRAGRLLRRTRLDELPQFIDVVKGDMSLVGPRPEVPKYVAHWPAGLKERALKVRPGLTDPSSLAFIDEAEILARAEDPEREYIEKILPLKLRAAVEYADRATLLSDVKTLLKTVATLVRRG
jgi:lipopolysaccharide/colanic/teichoic acid biosynthesis glycosyltransferase